MLMNPRMHRCYIILKHAKRPLSEKEIRKEFGRNAPLHSDLSFLVHNNQIKKKKDGNKNLYYMEESK